MPPRDERPSGNEVRAFEAAVLSLQGFVASLPAEALREKAWGPREVLAHLVVWIESHAAQAEALLAGRPVHPLHGTFDEINARAVEAVRGVAAEEISRRLAAACERLVAIASQHDPASLPLVLKKGSQPRPLRWFLEGEAGHIRWHLDILERQAHYDPAARACALEAAVDRFCQSAPLPAPDSNAAGALAHAALCFEALLAQLQALSAGHGFTLPSGAPFEAQIREAGRAMPEATMDRLRAAGAALGERVRTADPQDVVVEIWRLEMRRGLMCTTLDAALDLLESLLHAP